MTTIEQIMEVAQAHTMLFTRDGAIDKIRNIILATGLDYEKFHEEVVEEYENESNEYGDDAWFDSEYSTFEWMVDVEKAIEWVAQQEGSGVLA